MGFARSEYDVVLERPDAFEAQLAQSLLKRAGIPSILHGIDATFVDLGYASRGVARADLLVPKGARDAALAVLDDAWQRDALTDAIAMSAPSEEPEPAPSQPHHARAWLWLVVCALACVIGLTYAADFFG